ncbi:unnamed protein product [Malus baccata var. baccata]
MLFLLKTCHQLLHSEMTPTTQQTQLLQFQLQFLKKELGTSFSHNMDDECKKLIHRITPPRYMQIKIITCVNIELPGNQQLISLPRRW